MNEESDIMTAKDGEDARDNMFVNMSQEDIEEELLSRVVRQVFNLPTRSVYNLPTKIVFRIPWNEDSGSSVSRRKTDKADTNLHVKFVRHRTSTPAFTCSNLVSQCKKAEVAEWI